MAWLCARSTGSRFVLRFEDLDRVTSRPEHVTTQANDLHLLGIEWDGAPLIQSTRFDAHHAAINTLVEGGHTFECFCSRREVAEALHAPNGPQEGGRYPGTCHTLTYHQRAEHLENGRTPAIRLRPPQRDEIVSDRLSGVSWHPVDDVVLRRNDGIPAYNLAVVVDDAFQGVEEVVRGDDLLPSAAPQQVIARLLGLLPVSYVHVPLAVNSGGQRLAKRDGAITLRQLAEHGVDARQTLSLLGCSLGFCTSGESVTAKEILGRFAVERLPTKPWIVAGS